jgi:hypothetical protein
MLACGEKRERERERERKGEGRGREEATDEQRQVCGKGKPASTERAKSAGCGMGCRMGCWMGCGNAGSTVERILGRYSKPPRSANFWEMSFVWVF